MRARLPRPALGLLALASCDGAAERPVALDPCGFAEPVAALIDVSERVDVFHDGPYVRVEAELTDRPTPARYRVVAEAGGCRYLKADFGFCDPPCDATAVCTPDDACAPAPVSISGGKLAIRGTAVRVDVEPEDWSPGSYVGPGGLPAPYFAAGDTVRATLAGADFPPASLAARGVAPSDAALTSAGLTLADGRDNVVAWTAGPDPEACIQFVLNGSNKSHGLPLDDLIVCEGPDDGRLVVPRALVEAFPYGTTPEVSEGYDWPHSELTRYTRATTDAGGLRARLVVRSTSYFRLAHPEAP